MDRRCPVLIHGLDRFENLPAIFGTTSAMLDD